MDKFWRGFNLAIGQNAIFGEDLIWRLINFVKFGGDLIWRIGNLETLKWMKITIKYTKKVLFFT